MCLLLTLSLKLECSIRFSALHCHSRPPILDPVSFARVLELSLVASDSAVGVTVI